MVPPKGADLVSSPLRGWGLDYFFPFLKLNCLDIVKPQRN